MSYFSIISDSAFDLNEQLRKRFGIDAYISSGVIFPDGHLQSVDLDWRTLTPEEYYGSMVDKKLVYKSAAPGSEQVKQVFRKELEKGNDILCITLSSGMSTVYDQCCIAATELLEEYTGRNIRVIDSKRYSTAIAQYCIAASNMRSRGSSLQETAEWIEEHLNRVHQTGWMDDLFFLARAGRLSKGTAFMGTVIGVKPIADFNMETGMFQVIGKARGAAKALNAIVEYIRQTIEDPQEQIIFVANSLRDEYAHKLADMIMEKVVPKEIIFNSIGQSCGANIGPGLVAAFYFGKPLSEGLTEETDRLQRILK